MEVRNMGKDRPAIKEGWVLANLADRRMVTFGRETAKTHALIWGASKRQGR
jgi:hypothetical protein